MEKRKEGAILSLIMGKVKYEQLITDVTKEFCNMNISVSNIEPILQSYFIVILIMGFSKQDIKEKNFTIVLLEGNKIVIGLDEFCSRYEKYILEIENFKKSLLEDLI